MLPYNTPEILFKMGFTEDDFHAFDPLDGTGVQLTWLSSKPQPTETEIHDHVDHVKFLNVQNQMLGELSLQTRQKIIAKYSLEYQLNITNGIRGSEADKEQMINDIKALLTEHDLKQAGIKAATTLEKLQALKD